MVVSLLSSPEYYSRQVDERGTPEAAFVSRLYQTDFNRPLDPAFRPLAT